MSHTLLYNTYKSRDISAVRKSNFTIFLKIRMVSLWWNLPLSNFSVSAYASRPVYIIWANYYQHREVRPLIEELTKKDTFFSHTKRIDFWTPADIWAISKKHIHFIIWMQAYNIMLGTYWALNFFFFFDWALNFNVFFLIPVCLSTTPPPAMMAIKWLSLTWKYSGISTCYRANSD